MIPALLPLIGGLADKAFDRLWPDKTEADRATAALLAEAAKLEHADIQSFRDFVVAYEGSGDKVTPGLQLLRGSVRPVITYALFGLLAYGFVNPDKIKAETMSLVFNLNLISMGFWYGERAAKNLGMDLSGLFNKTQRQSESGIPPVILNIPKG
jgi:hypothetical protein